MPVLVGGKDANGKPTDLTIDAAGVKVDIGAGPFVVTVSGGMGQGTPNTLANAWPVEVTDGVNVLGTSTHPVRIDPTGSTTQPVSGTVTGNQGTANAAGTASWPVQGASATGAAIAGNPLLCGAEDSAGNAAPLLLQSAGLSALRVALYSGAVPLVAGTTADASATTQTALYVSAIQKSYNGATVDMSRNNADVTDLAAAARTTAQNIDLTTYNGRGIIVTLDLATYSGSGGLTVSISHKDPASGKFVQLHANFAQIIGVGTYTYVISPSTLTAAAGGITALAQMIISRTIRISVAVGDNSSQTYSLGHCLLAQ